MAVINTNITSMIGQQNLNKSQSQLSTAMERLSSGLRINSAKDDAAGQAIANRMTSQVTGLNQASRNANDGISMAQTTEGALNQINDNLQRVRELTVQAQNGTNSADDLSSIQDEINQRLDEINRVSKETDFNGTKVLATDNNEIKIQVGSKDGETISLNLSKVDTDSLSLTGFDPTQKATPELGDKVAVSSTLGDVYEVKDSDGTVNGYAAKDADGNLVAVELAASADESDGSSYSAITYTDESGATKNATYALDDTGTATVGATAEDGKFYTVTDGADWSTAVAGTEVATQPGALAQLDSAIKDIDSKRSELGAVQNRFESAIDNLSTTSTNISAAKSRIEDADYAVEVSNMTRAQILQQAGTSVLAQANQVPQGVLSLLQ